jgi:8-oxo-dGTP diphosphatase
MELDKCDELKWVTLDNLPINTVPYIRYAIQQYVNKQQFTDFGW